jgi:hypothetical protein
LTNFLPNQLAAYRQTWRNPETIRGMCEDYHAAPSYGFDLDATDLANQVVCPALGLSEANRVMNQTFGMIEVWTRHLAHMQHSEVPSSNFLADQNPKETLAHLQNFLLENGRDFLPIACAHNLHPYDLIYPFLGLLLTVPLLKISVNFSSNLATKSLQLEPLSQIT